MLRILSLCCSLSFIFPAYAFNQMMLTESEVLQYESTFFDEYAEQAYFDCLLNEQCTALLESPIELPADQTLSTLGRCLNACAQGEKAINAFCRTVPHPYVKAACWTVSLADYPVCAGFCYNYYGR